MKERLASFIKREAVLCAAITLAAISMFLPTGNMSASLTSVHWRSYSVSWVSWPDSRKPACSSGWLTPCWAGWSVHGS